MFKPDVALFALTFPEAVSEAALGAGCALARRLGGELTLMTLAVRTPPRGGDWSGLNVAGPALAEADESQSRAAAQQLADVAKALVAPRGQALRLEPLTAVLLEESDVLRRAARTRDLVLMPVGDAVPASRSLAEAVLVGAGRPLLVYPDTLTDVPWAPFARVAIAWDGSVSATRAVADALPVLRVAEAVTIVTVDGPSPPAEAPTPEALALYLARHDIRATVNRWPAAGHSVSEALEAYVAAEGPDLVVMGGYGHGRVREALLGGVTRRFFDAPQAPMLVSH